MRIIEIELEMNITSWVWGGKFKVFLKFPNQR